MLLRSKSGNLRLSAFTATLPCCVNSIHPVHAHMEEVDRSFFLRLVEFFNRVTDFFVSIAKQQSRILVRSVMPVLISESEIVQFTALLQ